MQNQNTKINFLVGLFVLGGIIALLFLALQAANLSSFSTSKSYEVTAYFDNIGGLKARAPVRSAGVLVGRVKSISYDNDTFQAKVVISMENQFKFPADTSAKILTAGLIGEQYIGLQPGADDKDLTNGGRIEFTQSAVVLENLISQFMFNKAEENAGSKKEYEMKKKILALALVGAALLSGCASVPKDAGQNPDDPWESLNRQTFAFNQGLDFILIRPLAKGYQFITPKPVREGVTRVFQNTMEPSNAVNNVLQGKVEEGILSLFRLMINSTVGVVGIFDVAQMVDIPRMPEDFGQTLATWGVPKGPYFVIPVLGPSTVRDTVGLVPEIFLDPNTYVGKDWFVWPWWGAKFVNARERLLPVTDMLDKTVDPYVATRNAYLQQRQNSLQDGDGPAMIQQPLLSPFSDEDSDNADKTAKDEKK